jgi:hypothetical protein
MQHRVVIRAMDVIVRRAVIACHMRAPARVPDAGPRVVPPEHDRRRLDGARCERGVESPSEQELRRVGRYLDARAHIAELTRRLEECDAVSGVRERVRTWAPGGVALDEVALVV